MRKLKVHSTAFFLFKFSYFFQILVSDIFHDQKQEKHYLSNQNKDNTTIRNVESASADVPASLGIREFIPKRRHTHVNNVASPFLFSHHTNQDHHITYTSEIMYIMQMLKFLTRYMACQNKGYITIYNW